MSSVQIELKLRDICSKALEKNADEIYLLVGAVPFLRIEGKIKPLNSQEVLSLSTITQIKEFLAGGERDKLNQHFSFVYNLEKIGNLEVTIIQEKNGPSVHIKILDREIKDLSKMGLPHLLINLVNLEKGIVFITGPRNSGKSSLAASIIDYINKRQSKLISTLEKPIKYKFRSKKSLIEQREVGRDVSSFYKGLCYIRENNIDVAMVSKVETRECLDELFAIAERGTLIFAITYFDISVNLIRHLLHLYLPEEQAQVRYFLSRSLGGIICTRLVPRVGGGRIRALEILPAIPSVRTIINRGKLHQLDTILQGEEAISLDRYLADLITSGEVVMKEGIKAAADPEGLRYLISR